jgi:peptidyl-tRNA hydrolase
MNPVQYIIIDKGLGMSAGKMAAQACHASVEGVRISAREPNGNPWDASLVNRWYRGGHYAKIILEVADATALRIAQAYIESRGFKTALIIDEGRTEIPAMSATALGCEIVDKDWPHARETFSVFDLYTDSANEEARSNECFCNFPKEIEGWCMRCGGEVF